MIRIELDNRGLEPPEPMMRILTALEQAEPGTTIIARNDRKPMFLFPKLDERGCRYEVDPLPDGSYRITIRKPNGLAPPSAAMPLNH